jgi:putative transposase
VSAVELVDQNRGTLSVDRVCALVGITPSAYYKAKRRGTCQRHRDDERLGVQVRALFARYRGRYGSPRLARSLSSASCRVGRHRVARIMRKNGLKARGKRRFFQTTQVDPGAQYSPNLVKRNFVADRPNQLWVGDLTYIPTVEGWLFLAMFLDVYSRKVVGWATATSLDADIATRALRQAIGSRRPPRGLVHHTDRGGQYTDAEYRKLLEGAGMVQSMSNPGNCLDNAMAESFFATLKTELGCRVFASRAQAHRAIAQYIDGFYNPVRLHSALSYDAPIAFERRNLFTTNLKTLSV